MVGDPREYAKLEFSHILKFTLKNMPELRRPVIWFNQSLDTSG